MVKEKDTLSDTYDFIGQPVGSLRSMNEIDKASFKRELIKLFLEIRSEINLKYRRKRAGWRRHRRSRRINVLQ